MPLTTTATSTLTVPMNSSSSPTISGPPLLQTSSTIAQFTPGQCLLCPLFCPTFTESVAHMQKSHGLFIPDREHLAVDLKTLFQYLHWIIFDYHECIQCGTSKGTVQAVQQHMIGKGHCKFDISEPDSEFADFYEFSGLGYETESDVEDDCIKENLEETSASLRRQLPIADKDSIRLPSGRIISRKSAVHSERSLLSRLKRRNRITDPQIEYSARQSDSGQEDDKGGLDLETHNTTTLSRRDKKENKVTELQLRNMNTHDRKSLMQLSAPQQRSLLATQHRQAKKAQKEEQRKQSHIDRKGNKNLYAYWATETPVYLCG